MTRSEFLKNKYIEWILTILSFIFCTYNAFVTLGYFVIKSMPDELLFGYDFKFWFLKTYFIIYIIILYFLINKYLENKKEIFFILVFIISTIIPVREIYKNYKFQTSFNSYLEESFEEYNSKTKEYGEDVSFDDIFPVSVLKYRYKEYVLKILKEEKIKEKEFFKLENERIGQVLYGRI